MTISSYLNETKKYISIRAKLPVKGLNIDLSIDTKIKEICLIRHMNMEQSKVNYWSMPMPITVMPSFNAFDQLENAAKEMSAMDISTLSVPKEYAEKNWFNLIKLYGHLNYREVCRILNHAACWVHCIENNHPVIVLEEGAMVNAPHEEHYPRASIIALGDDKFAYLNNNVPHIPTPWAYSIDPVSARMLLEDLIEDGMVNPLPLMITPNRYNLICLKKAVRVQELAVTL